MRILANENFPGPVVRALRERGHDVAWIKESQPSAADVVVLELARDELRLLVTFDADFGRRSEQACALPSSARSSRSYQDDYTGLAPGVPCGRFVGSDAELVLSGRINSSGTFTRSLSIPATLGLCGTQFVFQALVGPPAGGGKARRLSRSNGVRVTIGS